MPLYLAVFQVTTEVVTPCYGATQAEAEAWLRAHEAEVRRRDGAVSEARGTVVFQGCRPVTRGARLPRSITAETLCWGVDVQEMTVAEARGR